MSETLERIEKHLKEISALAFKPSGIFANSLLKTSDTTQIIRDIRDEEVVFFQGKKIQDIDYEMMNSLGFGNNDQYAQYEVSKLLDAENNVNSDLEKEINSLIPKDLRENQEYQSDISELIAIYKRSHIIKRLWASSSGNMLDSETNHILNDLNQQMDEIFDTLKDMAQYHSLLKSQREKLNSSYNNDIL